MPRGDLALEFPPPPPESAARLTEILEGRVTVANPFDFHTHAWFDRPRLRAMFGVAQRAGYDLVGFMIDCPPPAEADAAAYLNVIEEFALALPGAAARGAVISSLPESLPEATRERCLAAGIVPLQGQRAALEAVDLAGAVGLAWAQGAGVTLLRPRRIPRQLAQPRGARRQGGARRPRRARAALERGAAAGCGGGRRGARFPRGHQGRRRRTRAQVRRRRRAAQHRTAAQASEAARQLSRLTDTLLIEEMITDGVAEILVGVNVDPQFGQLLVLGAGGVMTELLRDSVTLLPPFTASAIAAALARLKVAKLLGGFRRRPAADLPALIETVLACARYAESNLETLTELDINPVIVRPAGRGALAVDALIRLAEEP